MANILVEVCAGSVGDVFRAKAGGAARVELNSALFMGGLTPSVGAVRAATAAGLPIMAMVRPRESGFCYDEHDFAVMLADARSLLDAGASGIVFGVLQPNGTVDAPRCAEMLRVIGSAQSVFHRAIDIVPDWRRALDTLMELGFTRVLTSGQRPSVQDGAETVCQMREYAAGRIEILPGGGISLANVGTVLAQTGCGQIHVSMRGSQQDPSIPSETGIHFMGGALPPEDTYSATDSEKLAALMSILMV